MSSKTKIALSAAIVLITAFGGSAATKSRNDLGNEYAAFYGPPVPTQSAFSYVMRRESVPLGSLTMIAAHMPDRLLCLVGCEA
jgi:hypothetical protein